MLISVVLLGTVIVATLSALHTTVIATRVERDHSKAGQWLQSAVQIVKATDFGDCKVVAGVPDSEFAARTLYENEIKDNTTAPYGWTNGQIQIEGEIEVWSGTAWEDYTAANACVDDLGPRLQRVRIQVTSPGGDIIEDIEVVKSG